MVGASVVENVQSGGNGSGGVLAEIMAEQNERRRENWGAYMDLVLSLAKNEQVDPAEISICLHMVGRTPQEMEQDVRIKRRRLYLHAVVTDEPNRNRAVADLSAELDATTAELNRITAELLRKMQDIRERREAAMVRRGECFRADNELLNTCSDPVLLHRQAELTREILSLRDPIRELEVQVQQAKSQIRVAKGHIEGQRTADAHERLARYTADLENSEAELAELRRRSSRLSAELDEVTKAKRLP
jgi:chromosome segregation ATPase